MAEREFLIDDRIIIPADIKSMTKEELQHAIKQFEEELSRKSETA